MNSALTSVCFLGLGVAVLLALVRVIRGPTILDRILAFDLIATGVVGMIGLLSVEWKTALFLELVLLYSLLGFVGTVSFTLYLHRTLPRRRSAAPTGNPARADEFEP